jgi:hypothetical protein
MPGWAPWSQLPPFQKTATLKSSWSDFKQNRYFIFFKEQSVYLFLKIKSSPPCWPCSDECPAQQGLGRSFVGHEACSGCPRPQLASCALETSLPRGCRITTGTWGHYLGSCSSHSIICPTLGWSQGWLTLSLLIKWCDSPRVPSCPTHYSSPLRGLQPTTSLAVEPLLTFILYSAAVADQYLPNTLNFFHLCARGIVFFSFIHMCIQRLGHFSPLAIKSYLKLFIARWYNGMSVI